ncbi:MAG: hypothetical protein ACYDD4_09455, partial [Acidimicrobiales bacterium]
MIAVAVLLGAATFLLGRGLNERDSRNLLALDATNAQTSVTAIISQFESALSSAGQVAAATHGDRAILANLRNTVPALQIFSALAIIEPGSGGTSQVVDVFGTPPAKLAGSHVTTMASLAASPPKGITILGFTGSGHARELAVAL